MRRLADALLRVLIAIATIAMTAGLPAEAVAKAERPRAFAQVKCVGLYCAIVSVPAPHWSGTPVRPRRMNPRRACNGHSPAAKTGVDSLQRAPIGHASVPFRARSACRRGATPAHVAANHSPRFEIDEEGLLPALRATVRLAFDYSATSATSAASRP